MGGCKGRPTFDMYKYIFVIMTNYEMCIDITMVYLVISDWNDI